MNGTTGTPGGATGRWSLRARLTVVTAGLLCVALAVGAVVLSTVLSRGRVAALDEGVRARAVTVGALVSGDRVPESLPVTQPGEIVQVLDDDDRVVASSPTASRTLPVLPAEELAVLRERAARTPGRPVVGGTGSSAYDSSARVAALLPDDGDGALVVATLPLTEVEGLVRALGLALVAVVPVLTALLGIAIWLALGRALRPVEELRAAAAQVARTGGPGALPDPGTDDEIGALARTLNEMLDRLEVAAARQRTFVADAAHELRTPLAALGATLDVARRYPGAYERAELLTELEGEARRMRDLVEDLLLLARVGSRPVRAQDVDLAAVARDAVALAVAAAGTAQATGRAGTGRLAGGAGTDAGTDAGAGADEGTDEGTDAGPGGGPAGGRGGAAVQVRGSGRARGDADAVGRVVRNLVDNALRHARTRVEVVVADGSVTVEDDGPGIAAADRERVFERFVRLDDARARRPVAPGAPDGAASTASTAGVDVPDGTDTTDGTDVPDGSGAPLGGSGLGLAIARELAREQGGEVTLAAAVPGPGLRARVQLRHV